MYGSGLIWIEQYLTSSDMQNIDHLNEDVQNQHEELGKLADHQH